MARKVGSKDKTKRRKKIKYGFSGKIDASGVKALSKAAAVPTLGIIAGGTLGNKLANKYLGGKLRSRVLRRAVGGMSFIAGSTAGYSVLGGLNRRFVNTEGYFTPESTVKKYRTKTDRKGAKGYAQRQLTNPWMYI